MYAQRFHYFTLHSRKSMYIAVCPGGEGGWYARVPPSEPLQNIVCSIACLEGCRSPGHKHKVYTVRSSTETHVLEQESCWKNGDENEPFRTGVCIYSCQT